jgi:hypothetical protein
VPPTALVSAYLSDAAASSGDSGAAAAAAGVKVGSLQQFVESEGDCEERGEHKALAWGLDQGLLSAAMRVLLAADCVHFVMSHVFLTGANCMVLVRRLPQMTA